MRLGGIRSLQKLLKRKKMKKYKTKNCNQYTQESITVCASTAVYRERFKIEKKHAMLFIGGAYDQITRKFAAEILKQARRDARRGGAK